jgi:hypothetical protein
MMSSRFPTAATFAPGFVILTCSAVVFTSAGADPAAQEKLMEAWWADLEKGEEPATRSVLKLSARPKEAVAFLKGKIKPLTISSGQAKALLLKLANGNEAVWKKAFEELEYFDPRLAIDLETLMERVTDTPARQHMVEVLSGHKAGSLAENEVRLLPLGSGNGFNFVAGKGSLKRSFWAENQVCLINKRGNPKPKWTRAVRAIVLLEHIASPDAVAILNDMAAGHPEAEPTKAAKEALERVARTAP